jgi:hypothetical protein
MLSPLPSAAADPRLPRVRTIPAATCRTEVYGSPLEGVAPRIWRSSGRLPIGYHGWFAFHLIAQEADLLRCDSESGNSPDLIKAVQHKRQDRLRGYSAC